MLSAQEEDAESDELRLRRRENAIRRAQLYGVSSKKKLPCVQLQPHDARARKELQLLMEPEQHVTRFGLSVYEDELERRKYHEHLGIRPPLDRSQPLNDLYTTVPKRIDIDGEDKLLSTAKQSREWRLGYKNEPKSDFHGMALSGVFEPSDTTRERLVQTTDNYKRGTTALAYQTPYTTADQVVQELKPYDAEKVRKEVEVKLRVGSHVASSPTKRHWSPASSATLGVKPAKRKSKAAIAATKMDQRFPVRSVTSPLKKVELETDPRHLRTQQAMTNQANEAYSEIQHHTNQAKDPTLRYSLPIENPKYERSYRLGLDPVPSTPESLGCRIPKLLEDDDHGSKIDQAKKRLTKSTKPPLLFRPKSAVALRMDTTMSPGSSRLSRASSSASLLARTDPIGKVAGAKRRPYSATVAYLSSSTVYCMNEPIPTAAHRPNGGADTLSEGPPSSTSTAAMLTGDAHDLLLQERKYGTNFLGVVLEERVRRHESQQERLFDLSRRGILRNIPMPQIFARLRREALKNLTKRIEYARYEKLPLEDYMSICGMAVLPAASPPRFEEFHDTRRASVLEDENDEDEDQTQTTSDPAETSSPVLQALRDEVELRKLPFDEPANSAFRKHNAIRPEPVDGNNSSTVQAMRKALFVTRDQFHIAVEPFALHPRDVNLLFSALDLDVADNVPLWEIICAVEQLQGGHEEIRRSRVQIKSRLLPKELATLRRSVSFPHRTHVALPLGSLR